MSATRPTGFTIVELLIVIVVIAILAAIAIASYTGIQTRANDSVVAAKVSSIAKMVEVYGAASGGYVPHADWACVGQPEDFPAENGYAAEWCIKPDMAPPIPAGWIHPIDPTVNAAFETLIDSVPDSSLPEVVDGSYTWRGIVFDSNSSTNSGLPVLGFRVSGNRTTCPIGVRISSNTTSTRCEYHFTGLVEE